MKWKFTGIQEGIDLWYRLNSANQSEAVKTYVAYLKNAFKLRTSLNLSKEIYFFDYQKRLESKEVLNLDLYKLEYDENKVEWLTSLFLKIK